MKTTNLFFHWGARRMLALLAVTVFCETAALAAGTNDLTSLLQRGLFEEEANRNLAAAIENYQSLAKQFDTDREIAATAVFRLGECYRKLGQTNEAVGQYERIVRDFADQQTLVTLSRQNLAGMGRLDRTVSNQSSAAPERTAGEEARRLTAQLSGLEHFKDDPEKHAYAVLALFPDDGLKRMLLHLPKLQDQEARLKADPGVKLDGFAVAISEGGRDLLQNMALKPPGLSEAQAELQKQFLLISQRVAFILSTQRARLEVLQAMAGPESLRAGRDAASSPATTDDEEKEIHRIQAMIQNSPDLINARGGTPNLTPLANAANLGYLQAVRYLLDHGANINPPVNGTDTPLHWAALNGNKAIVELLLSRGANVNAKDSRGRTPLHLAAEKGFQAVVEVLLASNAGINEPDKSGITALQVAAQYSNTDLIKLLISKGAEVNIRNQSDMAAVDYAAAAGNPEAVKALLDAKANPNGGWRDTPLLCAIIRGRNPVVTELLLEAGADPNKPAKVTPEGAILGQAYTSAVTPLAKAISLKKLAEVKLLLKFKADPNDSEIDGRPLIFNALSDTNILEALITTGAKVETRDKTVTYGNVDNWTPLHAAAKQNNAAAVEILLKHGAEPNARDANSKTALHWAAMWSADRKIFELLLDHHAEPNVRDIYGTTPLYLVNNWNNKTNATGIADLLRRHGALDNLPNWNRIAMSRPPANFSFHVFRKGTNDWNQFTLLETILNFYKSSQTYPVLQSNNVTNYPVNSAMPFPDLTRVIIRRPSRDSTNETRILANLLNSTNGIDCSKDIFLGFGDVVEIPERNHALGESPVGLTSSQENAMVSYLKGNAELVVLDKKAQLPLYPMGNRSIIGTVLDQPEARNILLSSSDLSRVKVSRRDLKSGKQREWILDCSNPSSAPDLWLRDGDVIEVPDKP